jgi:hypothetical protein
MTQKKIKIPWNKGLTNETDKRVARRSRVMKKLWKNPNHPYNTSAYRNKLAERSKGSKNPNYGGLSEEHKKNLSKSKIGKSWGKHTLETKRIISEKHKGIPQTEKHKEKLSKYRKDKTYEQIYGEKEAKKQRKRLSKSWIKDNNPNWAGGKTPTTNQVRHLPGYNEWRDKIFKRDNYTCQECKNRGVYLHAHHKKPFSKILKEHNIKNVSQAKGCKELWDIDNGITLCTKCHDKYRIKKGQITEQD